MCRPVVDWAKSAGVKQFLFISSAGIYKPTDEPPHVEGVCCLFIVPVAFKCIGFSLFKEIFCHHHRMSLKLMLVMLEWRNTSQRFLVAGLYSVRNT